MFKKILVPLDGSECAEVVFPYAEQSAGRLGAEVHLLYVSESANDPQGHMRQYYLNKVAEIIKKGAEKYLDKLQGKIPVVKSAIPTGNPAGEIVSYAEKEDVDSIIIATHGHSGFKHWALGNVTDKVLRGTKRPVVLIRCRNVCVDVSERGMMRRGRGGLVWAKGGEGGKPLF